MNTPIIENGRHPFVVIEGIDGVGKTTTARLVAQILSGEYYRTPSTPFDAIRAAIDHRADSLSRFYFYLSSVCLAATEIASILKRQPVVCDRYIYSTYAYHFVMDAKLRQCALPHPLLMPDLGVLLIADEEDRQVRLLQRGIPTPNCSLANEQNSEFLRRVENEFRAMPLEVINTSKRQPDSIAAEIVTVLQGSLGQKKSCHRTEAFYENAAT